MKKQNDTKQTQTSHKTALVLFPFLLLLVFFFTTVPKANAQGFRLKGSVYENQKNSLPAATVILMDSDSTLIASTITDVNGQWLLADSVNRGEYILKVTYIGFLPYLKRITAKQDDLNDLLDVGRIFLRVRSIELGEVTISQDREPIIINGDTVQYNADSYATQSYARLNELLKKLPGFQVDRNGVITVNGEVLSKVYIDGKEVSGQSLALYLQNLPAEAIKSVKVFDSELDDQPLSESAGFKIKGMDLELKDEFRNMTFGSASAGVGTSERYSGEMNFNTFNEKNQLSVLGKSNNINDFRLNANQTGSESALLQTPGITTAHTGTISLLKTLSHRMSANVIYSVNVNNGDAASLTTRTTFFPNDVVTVTEDDEQATRSNSHNFGFVLNSTDSVNTVKINVSGSMIGSTAQGGLERKLLSEMDPTLSYHNQVRYNSGLENISGNASIYYHHNFRKKNRQLVINAQGSAFDNELRNQNDNLIQESDRDRMFSQSSNQATATDSYGLKGSYTEPISKKQSVKVQYVYSKRFSDTNVMTATSMDTMSNELSNDIHSEFIVQQTGIDYQFLGRKVTVMVGGNFQQSEFVRDALLDNAQMAQTFRNVLPHANVDLTISNFTKFKVQYRTSVREPSARELQPLQPMNDPFLSYQSNLSLAPEYTHRAKINLHKTSRKKRGLYLSVMSGVNYSDNSITPTVKVDSNLVRTIQYVNASENMGASATIQAGVPFKKLNSALKVSIFGQWDSYTTLLNDAEKSIGQFSLGFDLLYSYTYKKVFELNLTAFGNGTASAHIPTVTSGQRLYLASYSADLQYNFLNRLAFSVAGNYTTVENVEQELRQDVPILNLSLTMFLFKNRNARLKFSGINILNQRTNAMQAASLNSIDHILFKNFIGSFYSLSFAYEFQKRPNH